MAVARASLGAAGGVGESTSIRRLGLCAATLGGESTSIGRPELGPATLTLFAKGYASPGVLPPLHGQLLFRSGEVDEETLTHIATGWKRAGGDRERGRLKDAYGSRPMIRRSVPQVSPELRGAPTAGLHGGL